MPATRSASETAQKAESALAESMWKRIENDLEAQRLRIYEEIKNYPRPIPACDLQFNHLLEKRAGILQEMDRMHEAQEERLGGALNLLQNFIRASSYLDGEVRETITAFIEGRTLQQSRPDSGARRSGALPGSG
jgi:hypothetical protein